MTILTMTRKRQRRRDSTGSSASREMEPSKPPKDVLDLGRYLVRELEIEDSVDTLGRWMAHHLAELIDQAENAKTVAGRAKARKQAVATILKVWEHRKSLPGKAYPLMPYEDVLAVLARLRPDNNPFRYRGYDAKTRIEQYAADLFDSLTRLIIALIFRKLPPQVWSEKVDVAAIKALSKPEQYMLVSLYQWGELFTITGQNNQRPERRKKKSTPEKVNLDEVAIQLIDDVTTTLAELRKEIQTTGSKPNESSKS